MGIVEKYVGSRSEAEAECVGLRGVAVVSSVTG